MKSKRQQPTYIREQEEKEIYKPITEIQVSNKQTRGIANGYKQPTRIPAGATKKTGTK